MGEILKVRNPRTGKFDYSIRPPTPTQLMDLCARLRSSQTHWQHSGLERRIESMQEWKQILLSHKDELINILVTDTGRLWESRVEFDGVISTITRWCQLAPELMSPEEKTTAIPYIRLKHQLVPYSLVGIISPWNFPLLLSLFDAIPALLAGCAVAIKPSEITPRFIQPLVETIASVPGLRDVLAYVEGGGDIGAAIVEQVDLTCFTGSIATGKKVAAVAARRLIPAFLELGGKDPAIVLASADLELATSALLWGSVSNTGQVCKSIERIYVAQSIFASFVEKLIEKAKGLQLAYPSVESGQIGPLIAEKQAAIITEQLEEAVCKGAIIHCGGEVEELDGGLWCRPTVLTQVNHSMKVMREETFGPIMPVMPFATIEEAVNLANDTIYGLSGAVFSAEQAEALEVASRIEAGAISINDAMLTSFVHEGEKNSFKESGLGGSRMGPASLKRFLRKKAFLVKTESLRDPWWFNV